MRPSAAPLFATWLLSAVLLLLPALSAEAAPDLYRADLIAVDATAADAVAARAAAIEQGQRRGLATVFQRLTAPGDAAALPDPAKVNLDRVVRSYDVTDEQVASNRYLAKINVSYNPAEIRRLLAGSGIAYVQRPPAPILVIPALRTAAGWSLWDEDNAWRAAWLARSNASTGGLLEPIMPLGDVDDITGFPPRALDDGDVAALAALAQRYEAPAAYVVTAFVPSGDPVEGTPVRIEVLGPELGQPLQAQIVNAGAGLTPAESLAPVVEASAIALEAAWKAVNLASPGQASRLLVEVPLADLRGWVQIRRELETLPLVRSLRIDSLDRTQASLTIDYMGGLQQFESAVARLGFMLAQENDKWRLLPAGGQVEEMAPLPAVMPPL